MATALSSRISAAALVLAAVVGVALPLLASTSPASAQFPFFGWGEPQRRAPPPPRYQQRFNPFGFFNPNDPYHRERAPSRNRRDYGDRERAPSDPARAPAAHKPDGTPTTHVVVLGDSMADWLAYGVEEAYSDNSDVGVTRKIRQNAGLIRNESRNESYDWVQSAKDILAAEKPSFVVIMLGLADRQAIRERPARTPAAQPNPPQPGQTAPPPPAAPEAPPGPAVSHEFRSERWAELYGKRIDDMIAVLKAKGVPVLWVGLPIIRGARAKADVAYLNDLYRTHAEKAGISYVDVWEGFVDENGEYAQFGPDYEGQTRRLRSHDGVHFTKAGALKLGHYVERELDRLIQARGTPVALPAPEQPAPQKPSGPAPRPDVGPVVSLTAPSGETATLVSATPGRAPTADPAIARVLVNGQPLSAAPGRADDFTWPRPDAAADANEVIPPVQVAPAVARPAAPASPAAKKGPAPAQKTSPKRPGQAAVAPERERQVR